MRALRTCHVPGAYTSAQGRRECLASGNVYGVHPDAFLKRE